MKPEVLEIKLLPYSYKKIGYGLLVLAIPVMFGVGIFIIALDASFNLIADERAFWDEWNYPLVYYPLIIALALLNFSEEKEEDEMVQNLRYKAFVSGVFFLVIGLLLLPFYSNIYTFFMSQSIKMPDVGGMLGALLLLLAYIYGSFKYNLHAMRKKLEADEE